MEMLVLLNGHERSLGDWKHLLEEADPGFKLTRVVKPLGSILKVIEISWMGHNSGDDKNDDHSALADESLPEHVDRLVNRLEM
jgi:hypothetical protein